MGRCSGHPWLKKRWGQTRRIGGKKGSKRHLLVDGRGVPLSLVVTGANVHDVTQIEAVLADIMVKRPSPKQRRSKHLCADAGYRGKNAMRIILAHSYIPHVVGRKSKAERKKRDPKKKARRWVVEACHGWFNRFRKLLVRHEKLEHTFLALNHLAAAIIALRKIRLPVNIIYG
jgi:transposase